MKRPTIMFTACTGLTLVVLVSIVIGYLPDPYVEVWVSDGFGHIYDWQWGTPLSYKDVTVMNRQKPGMGINVKKGDKPLRF